MEYITTRSMYSVNHDIEIDGEEPDVPKGAVIKNPILRRHTWFFQYGNKSVTCFMGQLVLRTPNGYKA